MAYRRLRPDVLERAEDMARLIVSLRDLSAEDLSDFREAVVSLKDADLDDPRDRDHILACIDHVLRERGGLEGRN